MGAQHWGVGWVESPKTRHPTVIRFLPERDGRLELVSPRNGEMLFIPGAEIGRLPLALQARLHRRWFAGTWTAEHPCRIQLTAAELREVYTLVKSLKDAAPKRP
jgi:hypothetical protein